MRLKGWFARHGRQVAMVALFAVGALLAIAGRRHRQLTLGAPGVNSGA